MNNIGFRHCVFGGQFGSEGKGCVAEWVIAEHHDLGRKLVVFGENSPNSGHSNSKGKTRSLPVSSYYADLVVLCPDAAVDPVLLVSEIRAIRAANPKLQVVIHENAALITATDVEFEKSSSLEGRVASTVTGGGKARTNKCFVRDRSNTMGQLRGMEIGYEIVNHDEYFSLICANESADWLFECSQGLMLDVNLGYYPYVTSRTTHPKAAVMRNGLDLWETPWSFLGAYRCHPIRTGGNSGPTGGRELQWEELNKPKEIAVVTKRTRRVFEFSETDFLRSMAMAKPTAVFFTHADYLSEEYRTKQGFKLWLSQRLPQLDSFPEMRDIGVLYSEYPGIFSFIGHPWGRNRPATKVCSEPRGTLNLTGKAAVSEVAAK